MGAVELRGIFGKLPIPAIGYAMLLDGLDFAHAPITGALAFLGVGLAVDAAIDVIQTGAALVIFQDPAAALIPGGADLAIPSGFDVFPSFTMYVIARERLMKK